LMFYVLYVTMDLSDYTDPMTILSYLLNRRLVPFMDNKGRWGYLSESQITVAIDAIYDEVTDFNDEGFAEVRLGDEWFTIDKSGKIVDPPK
jgi:hypothetical protein